MPFIPSESKTTSVDNSRLLAPMTPVMDVKSHQVKGFSRLDTLSLSPASEKEYMCLSERPELPKGKASQPDTLAILAVAFGKAFNSMKNALVTQVNDFSQFQALSQTMSQSILQSTALAITKQIDQFHAEQELEDEMKKAFLASEILGGWMGDAANWIDDNMLGGVIPHDDMKWVMLGIGVGVMVLTIASSFLDGGASLAALPEEGELLVDEATAAGFETLGSDAIPLEDMSDVAADGVESTDEELGSLEGMNSSTNNIGGQDIELQDMSSADRTVTRDLTKTTEENTQSESIWKKGFKKILQMVPGVMLGSPMLINGIMSLVVSDKLDDVSTAQKNVGTAIAVMQENNMFYQFYQQLLKRQSSVVEEIANNTDEPVIALGKIMDAWRQISYGVSPA